MKKPIIGLAMMVKNESRIIERCLASVAPFVDEYLVIDTGSTDNTKAIVRKTMETAEVSGFVINRPWVDFGHNRSELLAEARKRLHRCDYLFLLDADHVLHVEEGALDNLTADAYLIELTGSLAYFMPYLVNNRIPFKYAGATHEFLTADQGFTSIKLPGVTLDHHGDGGTRHEKFERDTALLEKEYGLDPSNVRTMFYLAQTYRDVGRTQEAIDMYRRRVEFSGWSEEVYWSLFQIAEMTGNTDDYLRAWDYRPSRPEAAHRLIKKMNESSNHHIARVVADAAIGIHSEDILFVERWTEDYGIPFEAAIAYWYVGDVGSSKLLFEGLLERTDLPDHFRASVESNLTFCQ